jgi:hypothetical protein
MDANCEKCKFWKHDDKIPSTGFCRRYAPRPISTHPVDGPDFVDAVWPRTKDMDLCGEWQTKIEIHEDS